MKESVKKFSFFNLPGRVSEVEDKVAELEQEAGGDVSWESISGKPATFTPTIGTTASTAKAGNYQPTWSDVTGKPTAFTPSTHTHAWADITDKPAIIASGATQAEARTAIGAGTGNSNLTIGTTASTAKAGNYQPTWAEVTGKPATFPPTIGTTSTTAKAGDYTPSVADIPALPTSKITSGVFAIAQIPTGTTGTTVSLGNHNHAITADATSGLEAAANLQALAVALSTRIKALEDAMI